MNDNTLRKSLVELLNGGQAHITFEKAIEHLNPAHRNVKPVGAQHSIWEVLEHMRLAQEDILRYTLDSDWRSPEFPAGYWPQNPQQMSDANWQQSLSGFVADLQATIKLVEDPKVDLTAVISHTDGHTYLREILLIADHNAYHLGQILQLRKALEHESA
ncbi:MAG: DinB family protein [Acidobacteriota bacterium]